MMKKTFVLMIMLVVAAFAFAADVALVTWVEGEVTASIQDGSTEEVHEWLVEAAEMLPVDAEIMVQEDSSIKFVHFKNNVEYSFEAEAWFQITEDGVLSEQEFASSELQMVSAKFELDKSMRQQVGAVIADAQQVRSSESVSRSKSAEFDFIRSDSFDDFSGPEIVTMPPAPPASPAPPEVLRELAPADPVAVMLALPVEIAQLLAADINSLKVAGHDSELNTDVEGWVVIQFDLVPAQELSVITLNGDTNFLQTKVLATEIGQDFMVQAWGFERQNLLPQAAALWVEQASSGVELANAHLERLKALMLGD